MTTEDEKLAKELGDKYGDKYSQKRDGGQMKYREFWIKKYDNEGWQVVDETAHPHCLVHVIEHTALEPLIGMLEQSRNAMTRAFEQSGDQYYANIKQAIVQTLEAVNRK